MRARFRPRCAPSVTIIRGPRAAIKVTDGVMISMTPVSTEFLRGHEPYLVRRATLAFNRRWQGIIAARSAKMRSAYRRKTRGRR